MTEEPPTISKSFTPKLRFKDYSESWKKKQFGELFDSNVSNNTLSRDCLQYDDYTYKNIHYGDILTRYGATLHSSSDIIPNIKCEYLDVQLCPLHNGDLIVADTAEDNLVGKAVELICDDNSKIAAGLHTIVFRPKVPFGQAFMGYYLNSVSFRTQLLGKIQGTKVSSLNKSNFEESFVIAPSTKEQQQIGDFLSFLDDRILIQKQKCDSILRFKFGCLNRMFPSTGESEPQLSFKSDNKKWVHSQIDEICTFSKGSGYSKSDVSDEGEPLLLYGSLYTDYQTIIHTTKTVAAKNNDSVVSTGREVVIPASGETKEDIARASAIVSKGVIIGGDLNILVPKKELDPGFLAYSITYGPVNRQIVSKAQGATIVHLHSDSISQCIVSYPDLLVQRQICSFLETIDNQILFESQTLDKLHTIKNALLQKMLI